MPVAEYNDFAPLKIADLVHKSYRRDELVTIGRRQVSEL